MESSGFTRRTLTGEPLTSFPIKQFWAQSDGTGAIWWDLDYLYGYLRDNGVTPLKKSKWLAQAKETVSSAPTTSGACHLHLHRVHQPANHLKYNTCTTIGGLIVLAKCIAASRSMHGFRVPSDVLRHIATASCSVLQQHGPRVINCTWGEFKVDCDGRAYGWPGLCMTICGHRATERMVERTWDALFADGVLHCPFQCENHSLADVVVFVCAVVKQHRSGGRKDYGRLLTFQNRSIDVVLSGCLASLVSEVVWARYCNDGNDAVMRAPPAIRTTNCKRNHVTVDADAAWCLLEKATSAGISVEAAIALKYDDEAYGCHGSQGTKWTNFSVQLYYDRSVKLWSPDDVNHYNFVSDPGHHSYKECLVTLAYSWEQDWASG